MTAAPREHTATPGGRVTVVVPTRNSARTLARCLAGVHAQTYGDVELVVVDNRSNDDTPQIAAGLADRVEQWGPERSAQRNRGAAVGTGAFLLFLDSDQDLEPEVVAQAVAAFRADPSLAGLVIPELAYGRGWLAACRALEKELYLGDASVEAARIFRRSAVEAAGGYDERVSGLEDWDLPDRIAAAGHRIGRVEARVWHDEGRVRLADTFRKKRYYGRSSVPLPLPGIRPGGGRTLIRTSLVRRPALLARRPDLAAGLILLKAVESVGFLAGWVEGRRAARS